MQQDGLGKFGIDLQQSGNGKPLVLLHSLLCDSRAFQHIGPALEHGHRLVIPSLPGYGKSPSSNDNVEGVARQLRECFASMELGQFDMVGNGYGGFVALCFAQLFPDCVDRLVLLDSAAWFPPDGKAGVQTMKRNVEAGGMQAVVPTAIKRLFPDTFSAANPELVGLYRDALLGFDPANFAHTCQNLIDVDLRPGLSRLSIKALVAVGLEDCATPPPLAREMAKSIPGARLFEIPACGHAPHIQEPKRTLALLNEFLA